MKTSKKLVDYSELSYKELYPEALEYLEEVTKRWVGPVFFSTPSTRPNIFLKLMNADDQKKIETTKERT